MDIRSINETTGRPPIFKEREIALKPLEPFEEFVERMDAIITREPDPEITTSGRVKTSYPWYRIGVGEFFKYTRKESDIKAMCKRHSKNGKQFEYSQHKDHFRVVGS